MAKAEHIRAVAFDLDGTLVDSIADLAAAANAVRGSEGLPPLDDATLASFVGDGIGVLVHRTLSGSRDGVADEAQWQRGLAVFVDYYSRHLSVFSRPYAGAATALGLLKSLGLPLAVVTNKSEVLAVALLRQLGLADEFSLIVGGDTLTERKPAALPLLHTAEVLGVAPEELAMVGDSANDILAAKAAGCFSIGVRHGYADMEKLSADEATRPDWVADDLPAIYDYLAPILKAAREAG